MADRTLKLKNDISQLEYLAQFLESLGDQWGLSLKVVMNLNLVLEELVTNIIFYGFSDTGEHTIQLDFSVDDTTLRVSIADDGLPFDPTAKEQPKSLDQPLEERSIGGLGIHLVNTLMDSVRYERKNNHNIVYLTKKR
ncbi:MAG TPA: ATP-binding protein [Bacteroidales bacterium]|nr:ATP-binding protein [Bacteroidales bacterium]